MLEKPSDLSSYSLTRVGPTWATMAALSEPDKLALGNWIDKGVAVGQTAARYSASKLRTATLLKLCLLGAAQKLFREGFLDCHLSCRSSTTTADRSRFYGYFDVQSMEEVISTVTPSPDDVALALRPSLHQVCSEHLEKNRT